ncbi:MAG: hypothetical protein MZU95_02550 [Desulfomicrobium escambiense]|nr:hypothetical protein [Desulfomicrobium escambiense]
MLSIRNLKTYFRTPQGLARAVDGVSPGHRRGRGRGRRRRVRLRQERAGAVHPAACCRCRPASSPAARSCSRIRTS